MKRLLMIVAVAVLTLGSFTQQANAENLDKLVEFGKFMQEEFIEVDLDEVPQAVKDGVAENYSDYMIEKAAVNSVGIYKLEIEDQDENTLTVYFDENGKEIDL